MDKVFLKRILSNDKQTLGVVSFLNGSEIWMCKSLELAWKDNLPNVSCIPKGEYVCKYTRSNRFSKLKGYDYFTYEVLNVPARAGIRIHAANYFFQILGCIALGNAFKDINIDGQLDTIHSGNTVTQFEKLLKYQDFMLVID